jgi:hypothetical protein
MSGKNFFMFDHLLNLVEQEPCEINHYHNLVQEYRRKGDRKNELKWMSALLSWQNWIELIHFISEEKNAILSWQTVLSAYYYYEKAKGWPEEILGSFSSRKHDFLNRLQEGKVRLFDCSLLSPHVYLQYIVGPSGFLQQRHYFQDRLNYLIENKPQAVIFEWSLLKDVDSYLAGFITTVLEELQRQKIIIYFIPPRQGNLNFVLDFFQINPLFEQAKVPSEFEALERLKQKKQTE